jgi:serine/threonine protein kinase
MNANGLLHFDVHFRNILTDGNRVYITDFGLATSSRFELSDSELEFLERNKDHDGCYVVTEFVNWLVTVLGGATNQTERVELIRRYAEGENSPEVMNAATVIIKRYASIALVMNDFYTNLGSVSRSTPFPVEEILGKIMKLRKLYNGILSGTIVSVIMYLWMMSTLKNLLSPMP